jgi:TolB-like protein/Tfp pilus assembly protein PilF
MSLIPELQRRNVIRVAMAYVVAAWLIIQVVETIFPAFGFSDKAVRIIVIIFGIGFFPAVIAAWLFEFTPDGLKFDKNADRSATGSPAMHHKLDRVIIVVLLLGISFFAFDKFVLAPDRAAVREAAVAEQAAAEARVGFYGSRSIAVIPFVNMTSDPEQEYFVDGIAEEVLNLLARIRELRVISRSSAFAFKGQNLEIPDIAERLDVAHILEGSVRKVGNTVRVTAQLIEARTDTHLWSKTYERDLDDVFAIQDEIAADVAKNLEITLLESLPKSRYVDPEVFALTAQAKQLFEIRPQDVGRKMNMLLVQALEIDPDYVPALEWLSMADYFREREGLISQAEVDLHWIELSARILTLDPDNAIVDAGNAWNAAYVDDDLEVAAALFQKALSNDMSNSNAVRLAGVFARHLGRFDLAVKLHEHAVAIDPLCYQCLYQLSRSYMYARDYERALAARERFMAINSGGQFQYGLILLLQGEAELALEHYNSMSRERGMRAIAGRAMALFSTGKHVEAELELQKLIDAMPFDEVELITQVAAWMGKPDLAFEWFSRAIEEDTDEGIMLVMLPTLANLHKDNRWQIFRESVNRSAARLDAIEFDPDLPE